jgi:hypothetical protein
LNQLVLWLGVAVNEDAEAEREEIIELAITANPARPTTMCAEERTSLLAGFLNTLSSYDMVGMC